MESRHPSHRSRVPSILAAIIVGGLAIAFALAWDASRQPSSGRDWRLVAQQRGSGDPGQVQVLDDEADVAAAWKALNLVGPPAIVDFDRSLALWLTGVGTIGCPSRLDDISIDAAGGDVVATFSRGFTLGCDDGVVPDSFLVAVDRDRLPPGPFRVRLVGPHPPEVTPGFVEVDP
jgi:hypothetical protein